MNLQHLTDKTLLNDTKNLVSKELELTTKILHHLKEIQKRRLFSELRYPSLFAYCIGELGYSEGSAQRRIVASRMLEDIPEIEAKIEGGILSLTNISQANQFFREQSIKTPLEKVVILQQIENLSKDECERKLLQISGNEKQARESKKRISFEKTRVVMIFSTKTMEEIDTVKGLLHKQLDTDELFYLMAKTTAERLVKKKFKVG
jgi:hypothetical protein